MELTLKNISKRFGELVVLDEISASFSSGQSYAILGRSGSGKSTLLNIASGLDIPTSGDVCYDSKSILSLSSDQRARMRNARVGFIFQSHQLLPEFTVLENVAMPLFIRGVGQTEAYKNAENILSQVGLTARLSHRPAQLSGGEQQRVSIARALVTAPEMVFADEPTGSLDPTTAAGVWSMIKEMTKDKLLIVVTHDTELASSLDHRLGMISGGKLEYRD